MTSIASSRQDRSLVKTRIGINPFLIITLMAFAVFIIYMVGIETMPLVHNAFHDLRHGTGFPCH